jgi:hypothetical protein
MLQSNAFRIQYKMRIQLLSTAVYTIAGVVALGAGWTTEKSYMAGDQWGSYITFAARHPDGCQQFTIADSVSDSAASYSIRSEPPYDFSQTSLKARTHSTPSYKIKDESARVEYI